MHTLLRIPFAAAAAGSAAYILQHVFVPPVLHADTAFVPRIDVGDLQGSRYHLVNHFWVPDPQVPQALPNGFPSPFPHILGPNVVNNNLDGNVSLTNFGDGPEDVELAATAVLGGIGATLFHHGYSRPLAIKEAIAKSRKLLERHREEIGDPGMIIGVSIDGHVVWTEGLGFADFENRVPCHSDTVMRIASIGKAISMTIVAKLWEDGKLDLDRPVQDYVPDFPQKSFEGESITITSRHLISHLSGIRHYSKTKKSDSESGELEKTVESQIATAKLPTAAKYNEFEEPEYYVKEPYKSVKESLALFKDDPLLAKPGEEFLYSTHGWTLLCAVIEAASKRKLTDCLKDLFRDLGMQNTFLDEHEPIVYNRSRNYRRDKTGRLKNAPFVDNSYKWAGGGLLSTVDDLLKFAHILMYSFQWKDGLPAGYLKPQTLQNMWSLVDKTKKNQYAEGGYGWGWMVVPERFAGYWCLRQPHLAYHTGGAIGASSVLAILPRRRFIFDPNTAPTPPLGIAVTIVANLEQAALYRKSIEIAQIFDQVDLRCMEKHPSLSVYGSHSALHLQFGREGDEVTPFGSMESLEPWNRAILNFYQKYSF